MQTSVIPFSPLHLSEQGAPGHIGHCNWGTVWPKSSGKSGPFLERNDKLMGRTACSTLSNPPVFCPLTLTRSVNDGVARLPRDSEGYAANLPENRPQPRRSVCRPVGNVGGIQTRRGT